MSTYQSLQRCRRVACVVIMTWQALAMAEGICEGDGTSGLTVDQVVPWKNILDSGVYTQRMSTFIESYTDGQGCEQFRIRGDHESRLP